MLYGRRLAPCSVLLLLTIIYSYVSAKQNYLVPERWVLEDKLFLSTIFAKSEYLFGPCQEDAHRFLHDLINGSAWAIQMFDSATKYPEGILYGHTRHLGNFDECYNLQVNIAEGNSNIREINGKYCLIDIEYKRKYATSTRQKLSVSEYQNDSFNINNSFWKVIEELEDFLHIRRNRLQLAVCVPATCNTEMIEVALKIPLEKLGISKNIQLRTIVQPILCQTAKEEPRFTFGAGIYCTILFALMSVVIISTWYDCMSSDNGNNTSTKRNIMLHFSARRNYEIIFHVNYTHTGLDSIYFIRFITCIIIVCMHNSLLYLYNPIINGADLEKIFKIPFVTLIINSAITINIFFALSGVLLASQLLKNLDRYKQLDFVKNVVYRYLRLTPLYAVNIFFYIWILPFLGSGPYWKLVVKESTYCAKNWWINLLYINNYVATSEMCMKHSWYLAADFQLFLCGQFIIYVFWCMPRKIGYSFLGIITLISSILSFLMTYIYGASSIFRVTPYITKIEDRPEFETYYIKGHMCATGYFVGIIAGAILHDHKGSTWRLSKFWSHTLIYPIPVILYVTIQYWAHTFFITDKPNLLEEAIYAFCQRLVPALCVCSTIVILSVGSQLKFYYHFFTPHWIPPLANLSYGVYIVHVTFIMCDIGQARTARTYSVFKSVWDTIPLLIFSFLISLLFTICVEMPFRSLAKQLFPEDNKIIFNRRVSKNKAKQ